MHLTISIVFLALQCLLQLRTAKNKLNMQSSFESGVPLLQNFKAVANFVKCHFSKAYFKS